MADVKIEIERPRSVFPTFVGALLVFCLFGVLAVFAVRHWGKSETYDQQRARMRLERLKTYREDMDGKLNRYSWVDKEKGIVRIPIGRAMELATSDLMKKKVGPSSVPVQPPTAPLPPAEPTGAPPPAASPAPAPAKPAPAATPASGA